jgi:hypothetical protein
MEPVPSSGPSGHLPPRGEGDLEGDIGGSGFAEGYGAAGA